jgi:hypothetical protein
LQCILHPCVEKKIDRGKIHYKKNITEGNLKKNTGGKAKFAYFAGVKVYLRLK